MNVNSEGFKRNFSGAQPPIMVEEEKFGFSINFDMKLCLKERNLCRQQRDRATHFPSVAGIQHSTVREGFGRGADHSEFIQSLPLIYAKIA